MSNPNIGQLLLIFGLAVAVVGVFMMAGIKLPFGRLPGDLSGGDGNFSWSIPLGTSILLSVILTVVLNIVLRR
jgi:hypothetical protein